MFFKIVFILLRVLVTMLMLSVSNDFLAQTELTRILVVLLWFFFD